ncbi:ATP-binding protein [Halosolutus halophilus]|uniref:ATP-binding protein n=1 Tax=Halosolutus halophilus TaxID=1552990 RepID=UPI00223502E0|nr:ATP-binding protein [Halosolutus halophilus]
MTDAGSEEEFIADAKRHNEWWSEDRPATVVEAASLTPRSDFHQLLKTVDEARQNGTENLVYQIYGQTGIGKTTLFQQLIAALLDTTDFPEGGRDHEIVGSVSPRQILYVPLEASLYHLERPDDAITRLKQVVDYFDSHVAPRRGRKYILLDDVGALNLEEDERDELLDLVNQRTYLFLTGIVASQVDLKTGSDADEIDAFEGPTPVLPMKFVDTVQHRAAEGGFQVDFGSEFRERLEAYQSDGLPGPAPIKAVRRSLDLRDGGASIDDAIASLDELYFEHLSPSQRDDLHDASREYLQIGGTVHRAGDASVRNELTKSHFLLYLYKELAKHESIQKPENLHKLSSIAASQAGEELRYTDISDRIGVDRRTVDSYLEALDEGIAVSESHDYSLRRYRRTRLYLRNPRHVVLLSQRQEHYGFEEYSHESTLNHEFEYKLARTVAFDHAKRLAFTVGAYDVEYCETESGLVDYVLQRVGHVLPFVLSYHPYTDAAEQTAVEFDPSAGQHTKPDSEELQDYNYEAPCRFIITDSLPKDVLEQGSLRVSRDDNDICYLPYWVFLLIC